MAATIHIHHCHLLWLLSLKADNHFNIPQRVEGWVDLGTARRVRRLYIAVVVVINITGRGLSHCNQACHLQTTATCWGMQVWTTCLRLLLDIVTAGTCNLWVVSPTPFPLVYRAIWGPKDRGRITKLSYPPTHNFSPILHARCTTSPLHDHWNGLLSFCRLKFFFSLEVHHSTTCIVKNELAADH